MRSVLVLSLVAFVSALPFSSQITNTGFKVKFSLTNKQETPLTVCRWGTPLEQSWPSFRADMFTIVNEKGLSPVYAGMVIKRLAALSDLITLQPGETVSGLVDLQIGYWFPETGTYYVNLQSTIYAFNGTLGELSTNSDGILTNGLLDFTVYDLISSEVLSVELVEVRDAPTWMTAKFEGAPGAVTPVSCTSSQTSSVQTSDSHALSMANRVRSYVSGSCNTSLSVYITWMGACESARFSQVRTNFNNIHARIGNGYRVDCSGTGCPANTYAYVRANDATYTVYVCSVFWNAPASACSTDSRPGTIIHEISHFTPVAGTQDYAYGQTACRNLASSNPSQAIRNADNYEYFAEACP